MNAFFAAVIALAESGYAPQDDAFVFDAPYVAPENPEVITPPPFVADEPMIFAAASDPYADLSDVIAMTAYGQGPGEWFDNGGGWMFVPDGHDFLTP